MGITGLNHFLCMYCLDKKNDEIISAAKIRDIKILHYWIEESKCLALEFKRAKKNSDIVRLLLSYNSLLCDLQNGQSPAFWHWALAKQSVKLKHINFFGIRKKSNHSVLRPHVFTISYLSHIPVPQKF